MPRQLFKASINKSSSNHKISSASKEEKVVKMEVVAIGANDSEYLEKQDRGAVKKYTDICARWKDLILNLWCQQSRHLLLKKAIFAAEKTINK